MMRVMQASLLIASVAASDVGACHDVSKVDTEPRYLRCYKNVMWAEKHGLDRKPKWYKPTDLVDTQLDSQSEFTDYQWSLYEKTIDGIDADGKQGWGCPEPCTPFSSSTSAPPTSPTTAAAAAAAAAAAPAVGSAAASLPAVTFTAPAPAATANDMRVGSAAPAASGTAGDKVSVTDEDMSTKSKGMSTMWKWLLFFFVLCCVCPLVGLCCSAFLCYEAVECVLAPFCGGKKSSGDSDVEYGDDDNGSAEELSTNME